MPAILAGPGKIRRVESEIDRGILGAHRAVKLATAGGELLLGPASRDVANRLTAAIRSHVGKDHGPDEAPEAEETEAPS